MQADLCTLHIYNYQDAEANSYHFDALLTESARNSNAAKSSQGSTAASAGAPKATPSPKAGAGCQRTDDAKMTLMEPAYALTAGQTQPRVATALPLKKKMVANQYRHLCVQTSKYKVACKRSSQDAAVLCK